MGDLGLLLPLLILLPLLLITFRGRKQQKAFARTQERIAPGLDVVTTAGLYGRVLEVDGGVVVLEVADGVRLRWAKGAIGGIITPADQPAAGEPAAGTDGAEPPKGVGLTKGAGPTTPERHDG